MIAEGAGQKYFDHFPKKKDDSGNLLYEDIGLYIKDKITEYFKAKIYNLLLNTLIPAILLEVHLLMPVIRFIVLGLGRMLCMLQWLVRQKC